MIVVLMGVSGCGKSTVGAALAEALGWPFVDADDLHPPANVAKMAAGVPLTDADRSPWLDRIVTEVSRLRDSAGDVVLACSALRHAYRERLAQAGDVRFVHLHAELAVVDLRLAARRHRYMPASLLESQFAALEPPAGAIAIDVAAAPARCVDAIVAELQLPM